MSRSLELDHLARVYRGGRTLLGGDPLRVLCLSEPGAAAAQRLLGGVAPGTPGESALAERLIVAGIAHPRPATAPVRDVTVIIPVHDRAAELDRCLTALGAVSTLVVDDGSHDARSVAAVAAAHGARLIREDTAGGPAGARNIGLSHADTALVAFLDSDCVPEPGWLAILCGALNDPSVGAVAPRIRPLPGDGGVLARFAADRSPLDLGPHPARVQPGGRVAYVPTAALLARTAALGDGFDPVLRYGEDVDLVWRIHDRGWWVRYEPAATVRHAEPSRAAQLLRRRFAYGTSAGPLAQRHPDRLNPLRLHPRPAAVVGLLLARRPRSAALMTGVHVALTGRALNKVGVPPRAAATLALTGVADSAVAVGRATTMLLPGLLAVGLTHRRTAPVALALALAEPARSWVRSSRGLDPLRWSALVITDDMSYGAGVCAGALRSRTVAPLTPALVLRAFPARRSPQGGVPAAARPSG